MFQADATSHHNRVSMHHYPHHVGDYSKDTPGLTMAEHGAYRLLMDAYYAMEAPIPEDEPYAIAKASNAAERRCVDKVLRKFFVLEGGAYHQKRIDKELEIYRDKVAVNRENGRLGGRPRELKQEPKANPEITQTVSETKPTANPEITLTKNQEPRTKKRQKTPLPDGFGVSASIREWASKNGYANLEAHLAYFVDWARSSSAVKADWDATFRNAIRGNWAKVQAKLAAPQIPRYS